MPNRLGLAAACVSLALLGAPPAHCAPVVIFTVDVETTDDLPLPEQVDALCTDRQPCGLDRIANMLEERKLAGTFFLDVYEYRRWGETALRAIAMRLQNSGQDVELHTHPQWAYDPQRPYMYSYSAAEQSQIVRDGVHMLESWTGRPVLAHRGGAYSANLATLDSLAEQGVVLDSSLFLEHPHSRLNGLGFPANVPSRIGQVLEIPVTVYWRVEHPSFPRALLPPFRSVRKIDVNGFVDEDEARAAMRATLDAGLPCIVVFLHSFSLIDGRKDGALVANRDAERIFVTILDFIQQHRLAVSTMRDLAAAPAQIVLGAQDVVPHVSIDASPLRYGAHWIDAAVPQLGAGRTVALALLLAAAIAGLGFYRRARRRTVA